MPTPTRSSAWTSPARTARAPSRSHQVWIEGGSDIASEYYASVILDRSEKKLLAMVSAKGGMDIEAVAAEDPDALVKRHIDPTAPFDAAAARPIVEAAGLDEDVARPGGRGARRSSPRWRAARTRR